MADVVKLVKKLDFVTRKAVAHLRDAKANAVAGETIIEQLRDGAEAAKRAIGTYDYNWEQLAADTQEQRARLGYPPNEPLLRKGTPRGSGTVWQLIRLTFLRWRRQKHCIIDGLSQVKGCLNTPAQICNHDLIVHNATVRPDPSAVSVQRDVDYSICEAKRDSSFVKNEGSMRGIANRNYSQFVGARIGVICHDGSYRYWEWDNVTECFVPFTLT